MKKIDRIIREEINRYILSEANNLSTLIPYATQLNNALGQISNISNDKTLNVGARKFIYDFVVYCVQIVGAINRCVNANSLNEVNMGSLSSYGINIPSVLGGNLWQDAMEGYYKTKNFFQGYGNSRSGGYANKGTSVNGQMVNNTTVQQVKLSQLLRRMQMWQRDYRIKSAQYNFAANPTITASFNRIIGNGGIIPTLKKEYDNLAKTTQGTLP